MTHRAHIVVVVVGLAALGATPAGADSPEEAIGFTLTPGLAVNPRSGGGLGYSLGVAADLTHGVSVYRVGFSYVKLPARVDDQSVKRSILAPTLGYRVMLRVSDGLWPWAGVGAGFARTKDPAASSWGPAAYGELGLDWLAGPTSLGNFGFTLGLRFLYDADQPFVDLQLTVYALGH